MVENPFQSLGLRVPKRIGREREWNRLLSLVERNHLSVVGPKVTSASRYSFSRLQITSSAGTGAFRTSVFWDLRHGTPDNDGEFFTSSRARLVAPVRSVNLMIDTRRNSRRAQDESFKKIKMVFELLAEEHLVVLGLP